MALSTYEGGKVVHGNSGRNWRRWKQFLRREGRRPGYFIPNPESFATESSVISGGEPVASPGEMRGDDSLHLKEALRMLG